MTRNDEELRALLPWYANGTLDTSIRRELEQRLQHAPLLRSELAWLRLVRNQVQESAHADLQHRPEAAGLDTLMALIHAEQSGKVTPLPGRFLGHWLARARQLPLSMGIAAAVVLSQAVIIGTLLDRPAPEQLVPLSGGTVAAGPMLQVTFKPGATETQIRALLSSVQGDIVAGPGALGVYAVRVPERQGPQALEALRNASAVVDSVTLLPAR
ncbi:MAG: hypothetical protein V4858_07055 [Pseudomonadota bacterium]